MSFVILGVPTTRPFLAQSSDDRLFSVAASKESTWQKCTTQPMEVAGPRGKTVSVIFLGETFGNSFLRGFLDCFQACVCCTYYFYHLPLFLCYASLMFILLSQVLTLTRDSKEQTARRKSYPSGKLYTRKNKQFTAFLPDFRRFACFSCFLVLLNPFGGV
jgi:hypothetical protein